MSPEALASPRVLEWARRMAGLEQDAAARKAGVKASQLDQWERGVSHPTVAQLRKLADVYHRPLAVFFLANPPPNEVPPADFRRIDPDAEDALTPELRLAVRAARARREAALELFEDLGEKPPAFQLHARMQEDPEEVGERLRNALRPLVPGRPVDTRTAFNRWRAAAEELGVLVFQAEDVVVDEMRGFSISEHPLPVVVLNIKDAYAARSFSLFHELTHVLLNRGGLCVFEEGRRSTDEQRTEAFCNHVAGAALLPASLFLREPEIPVRLARELSEPNIEALANRYGTSQEAVLRRLVVLKRVSGEFYARMRPVFQKRYDALRKEQRATGGPSRARLAVARAGSLFTRLVLGAYDEERITASDLVDLLGERLKHLEGIRTAVRPAAEAG